jgi:nucleoside 2-deoxyribosyltransferase
MLAYLCGPIEFASDHGKMWRRKLTPFLAGQLGHRVYDPAEDERKSLTDEEVQNFRKWKTEDVDRFRRTLRKIIHFDLDLIENKADYVICYLDDSAAAGVTSGGTPAELTFAYRKGIPVYMVTQLRPDQISGWMLACADQLFDSVDTLKKFLMVRYGAHKQSQLWKE